MSWSMPWRVLNMRKWIAALLLFTFTICSCVAETAEPYDADADDLLNGVIAHAQEIHDDQLGYPVNEDIRLDGFYEWYLSNGIDEPCGLFLTTREVIARQNPYEVSYLNASMPMINCSRSALNPLKFYWIKKHTGEEGFRAQTKAMLENTAYLKEKLDEIGWPAWVSCEQSNTVFFKRPGDALMEKYYLAPDYDECFGGDLAHIVVMQSVTAEVIDCVIADMMAEQEEILPAA